MSERGYRRWPGRGPVTAATIVAAVEAGDEPGAREMVAGLTRDEIGQALDHLHAAEQLITVGWYKRRSGHTVTFNPMPNCGHCGRPIRGFGYALDRKLLGKPPLYLHDDRDIPCRELVMRRGHATPCLELSCPHHAPPRHH